MYKEILLEECKQYSEHKTLEEFNESFKVFAGRFKNEFTKGEYIALKEIRNRCTEVAGVAGVKLGTILKDAMKRLGLICPSRRTFQRAIKKASDLGGLTVVERKQKDKDGNSKNIQGHNIFVFRKFTDNEQLAHRNEEKLAQRQEADKPNNDNASSDFSKGDTSLFNSNLLKDKYIRKNNVPTELNSDYVSSKVPSFITNLLKPFYDSKKVIEESYTNANNIISKYKLESEANEILKEATISLAQRTQKDKKLLNSPVGYFTNAVKGIVDKIEQEKQSFIDDMFELTKKLKGNSNGARRTIDNDTQSKYFMPKDTKATREELDELGVF